jgi:hypothetical protein
MALDDGEQLFYEGMFFDSSLRDTTLDKFIPSTLNSSRAISAEITQDLGTEPQIQVIEEQIDASKQDDRALTCLSNFYAMFCWYRWQPTRRSYTKDQLALALKKRMQRSEVLCISVAAVAACYGFGDFVSIPDNSIKRSFIKHWNSTYEGVTSTKTRNLCAFLEWLGETSSNGITGHHHIATAQTMRQGTGSSQGEGQSQRDNLFSLASRVLHEIAVAANQDQELPTNRSMPLDTAALVHVDKYLHAAMDLATFCYASQSAQAFTAQLDSTSSLLNSLLGRSQCVKLSDLQGIDTTGFRTFAWADVINAVLTGRSTLLHYLNDEDADRLRHDPQAAKDDNEEGEQDGSEDDAVEAEAISEDGLEICFGCPDDVLVIIASIANLHYQLLHARKTGSLTGQGPESLPAWAVHAALDIGARLRLSQQEADDRQNPSSRSKKSCKTEHYSLGTMWRHAAVILLNTTAYRQGPLAATNQERLHAILAIWSDGTLKPMTVAMGTPAMPMLVAAFVAVSSQDRKVCMDALEQIGQRECGRRSYRRFVQKLWKRCDDTGFGILWQDLIPEAEEALAIM